MTKYWTLFYFNGKFDEVWNSSTHYHQTSSLRDTWKSQDVWPDDRPDIDDGGIYVYVEGEFDD